MLFNLIAGFPNKLQAEFCRDSANSVLACLAESQKENSTFVKKVDSKPQLDLGFLVHLPLVRASFCPAPKWLDCTADFRFDERPEYVVKIF
jgi:hypothetical protein